MLQSIAHEAQIHMAIDKPQQVAFRNLVFQAKVV
jgi:hypothetical protein